MGRTPCCDKSKVKKGPWSLEEDTTLKNFLQAHSTSGNWITLPTKAGLNRCGKSCRLRWLNYLRPDIKRGSFTEGEDNVICTLYSSIGSRWSVIASHLPGRTDNDVKNYWNTKLKKKILAETNKNVTTRNPSSSDLKATGNPKMESPRNHGSTSSCFDDILSYHQIDENFWGKSFEPCSHYSRLNPMEASGFGTSGTNSFGISSFQEASNLPTSSSLVENNFTVWSGNCEGAHNTGGFMDLGALPADHVLLDGFSY